MLNRFLSLSVGEVWYSTGSTRFSKENDMLCIVKLDSRWFSGVDKIYIMHINSFYFQVFLCFCISIKITSIYAQLIVYIYSNFIILWF